MAAVAVLVLATAWAGCTAPAAPDPGPASWGASTDAWTRTDAPLWLVHSGGCGFCSGDPDVPEFALTAVWQDGSVLALQYGQAPTAGGGGAPGPMRVGLAPYAAVVETVWGAARPYRVGDADARVLGVATARMGAQPWAAARGALASMMAGGLEEGGETDATDCGPDVVERVGAEPGRWEVGCGMGGPRGQGVVRTLQALHAWAVDQSPPTVAGRWGDPVPMRAHAPGMPAGGQVAAMLRVQACGGIAFGCSGASGVIVYEDGGVVGFWGEPWRPQAQGSTPCGAYTRILGSLAAQGEGWQVACTEEAGGVQPRGGRIPDDAAGAVLASLRQTEPAPVPAEHREGACCDRIHTQVRSWVDGRERVFVVEGTVLDEGTLGAMEWAGDARALLDLHAWLRPSAGTFAGPAA